MGLLRGDERDQLIKLLLKLPNISDAAMRRVLVAGFPNSLIQVIDASTITLVHLNSIVDTADGDAFAQLADSSWTIIRVVENAIALVIGSKLEREIESLKDALKQRVIVQEENAQFQEAMLTAFPSHTALEQLVKSQYDQGLETISSGTSLPSIVTSVVKWAERQGRLDLLRKARAAKPEDPLLRGLAEQLGLTRTTRGPVVLSADSNESGRPHLPTAQIEQLNQALLSAFPNHGALARMVRFGLNLNLDAVASGSSLAEIAFDLIAWCEEQGKIDHLVIAAREQAPGSAELRDVAEQMGLVPAGPSTHDLEQIISRGGQLSDVNAWSARMNIAAQAVCRVELAQGALATGFLLGPSLVMTCYYVIERLIGSQGDLTLRFDYQTAPDGVTINAGAVYELVDDWLVDHSPYPELDYALLRVAGSPGNDPVGGQAGAPPRRWLVPNTTYQFQPGDPLFCLQHPQGGPLKVAFETKSVLGFNSDATRIRYRVNTLAGSGGAPCFNSDLELVAIHEASDNNGNKLGIPIAAVAAQPKVQAVLGT